jgi:hypothetical protein
MTLRDVISSLASFDDDQCVFVSPEFPVSGNSVTFVGFLGDNDAFPAEAARLRLLMEVWQIREVLSGKAKLHAVERPTLEDQVSFLLDYVARGA